MADWLFLLRLGRGVGGALVLAVRPNRDKRELTERNQRMYAMRQTGLTFREIGATFNLTEVRAFVICKREEDRESIKYFATLID